MATLTFGQQKSLARLLMLDQDTTDPAIVDTDLASLLNLAMHNYFAAHPDLMKASAGSVTFDESTFSGTLTATQNFRMLTDAVPAVGRPLERIEWSEMLRLQNDEPSTAIALEKWAVLPSATSRKAYTVYAFPILATLVSSAVTFYGLKEAVDVSSDSASMIVGDAESRWIAMIAALYGCVLLGRMEQAQYLLTWIPKELVSAMDLAKGVIRPRPEVGDKRGA